MNLSVWFPWMGRFKICGVRAAIASCCWGRQNINIQAIIKSLDEPRPGHLSIVFLVSTPGARDQSGPTPACTLCNTLVI